MSAVFLTWLKASKKRSARILKQYASNIPTGIV